MAEFARFAGDSGIIDRVRGMTGDSDAELLTLEF